MSKSIGPLCAICTRHRSIHASCRDIAYWATFIRFYGTGHGIIGHNEYAPKFTANERRAD